VYNLMTPSPLLKLGEAADYLHVSKAHLSNILNGKVAGVPPIRSLRAGRRILIRREWIDEWIEATSRKAAV
jgi:excisionase family DNA binding protein